VHTPTTRNVTILAVLVTVALLAGCGSKSDATAAAQKTEPPKTDSAKPADTSAKPADGKPASPPPAAAAKPGLPVKAEPVQIIRVSDDVSAVGSLLAEESVIIRPEIDGPLANVDSEIADALQVRHHLERKRDEAQVGSDGLAFCQDDQTQLVGLDLRAIDEAIGLDGAPGQLHVLLDERLDGVRDHLLHPTCHAQQTLPQLLQLVLVLSIRMRLDHAISLVHGSETRPPVVRAPGFGPAHDRQPNLPVI